MNVYDDDTINLQPTPLEALTHVLNHVLIVSDTSMVQEALTFFGIQDITDFTSFIGDDFRLPFSHTNANGTIVEKQLPLRDSRLLAASLTWYTHQDDLSTDVWFNLSNQSLIEWMVEQQQIANHPATPPPSTASHPLPPSTPTLPSFNMKIQLSDYPKLKEDKHWRTFNRQLHAIAATHTTIDILNPTFVPSSLQ